MHTTAMTTSAAAARWIRRITSRYNGRGSWRARSSSLCHDGRRTSSRSHPPRRRSHNRPRPQAGRRLPMSIRAFSRRGTRRLCRSRLARARDRWSVARVRRVKEDPKDPHRTTLLRKRVAPELDGRDGADGLRAVVLDSRRGAHPSDLRDDRLYCDRHDAYLCPSCHTWVESPCSDPQCSYCPGRPDGPRGCDHPRDHQDTFGLMPEGIAVKPQSPCRWPPAGRP